MRLTTVALLRQQLRSAHAKYSITVDSAQPRKKTGTPAGATSYRQQSRNHLLVLSDFDLIALFE
jgi:hypothetical protein